MASVTDSATKAAEIRLHISDDTTPSLILNYFIPGPPVTFVISAPHTMSEPSLDAEKVRKMLRYRKYLTFTRSATRDWQSCNSRNLNNLPHKSPRPQIKMAHVQMALVKMAQSKQPHLEKEQSQHHHFNPLLLKKVFRRHPRRQSRRSHRPETSPKSPHTQVRASYLLSRLRRLPRSLTLPHLHPPPR